MFAALLATLFAGGADAWTDPARAATWAQMGHGISPKDLELLPPWRPRAALGIDGSGGELIEPGVLKASSRRGGVAPKARPILRHEPDREAAAVTAISEADAVDTEALLATRLHQEMSQLEELLASISDDVEALCTRLERGLMMLREASSTRRSETLEMILRAIGLQPAESEVARRALYGDEDASSALAMPSSLDPAQYVGLQSVPSQFACLLRKAKTWDVVTALEIGTGSGWASTAIAAYLSASKDVRQRPHAFRLHTVDVTDRRLDCVGRMQKGLGVSFHVADAGEVSGIKDLPRHFDLCLVDHKASVHAVRTLLTELRGRCRYFVMHGVSSELAPPDFRRYWRDLKERRPNKTEECVQMGRTSTLSAMGFGIFQP